MTKKEHAAIDRTISFHQIRIGVERDSLDNAIATLEQLKEDCEEAWDALQEARDALSRLV